MDAGKIIVREVAGAGGLDAFLKVPFKVFAGDPNWVPQLFFERKEHLSAKKNPYFQHADVQLFVAERNGEVVGRISAQIDHLRLERYDDATGQFGFLDAIDDRAVFCALTQQAGDWLKSRGMGRMQGPFSFSINEESGLLIEGFERPPSIMMPHGRPYYSDHMAGLGFSVAKDLVAYDYDGTVSPPRAMQRMVEKAKTAGGLEIRPLDKKHLERDLDVIMDIFNDAWSDNWGYVPMTRAEIKTLGENLKLLVRGEFIAIAWYQGEPAAMGVSLPNINEWIADLDGRLMPFGWAKLAWRVLMHVPKSVRIPLMGVRRKYHGTPAGSALAIAVIDAIRRVHLQRGTRRAELSWVLEDNTPLRRMLDALGARVYKTYRIYERDI